MSAPETRKKMKEVPTHPMGGEPSTEMSPREKMVHRRAVEAAVWGMPMVGTSGFLVGTRRDLGGDWNDVVDHSKPQVSRHGFLTANNQTAYVGEGQPESQRRWFGGSLLRPKCTERFRVELDSYSREILDRVPALRAAGADLRQNVELPGSRKDQIADLVHTLIDHTVKRPGFGDCSGYWVATVSVAGVC